MVCAPHTVEYNLVKFSNICFSLVEKTKLEPLVGISLQPGLQPELFCCVTVTIWPRFPRVRHMHDDDTGTCIEDTKTLAKVFCIEQHSEVEAGGGLIWRD